MSRFSQRNQDFLANNNEPAAYGYKERRVAGPMIPQQQMRCGASDKEKFTSLLAFCVARGAHQGRISFVIVVLSERPCIYVANKPPSPALFETVIETSTWLVQTLAPRFLTYAISI